MNPSKIFTSALLVLFACILVFSSCEETYSDPVMIEQGYDYAPLEVGKFMEYRSDSIKYFFDGAIPVTSETTTYVREILVDMVTDIAGDTTYVIERFEKKALSAEWNIKDIWSITKTTSTLEKTEENIRLVKMIFPLREGANFDPTRHVPENVIITVEGETMEAFKGWDGEILGVGVDTVEVNGFSFDDTAIISYADEENLVEKRFAQEIYARNIGMVYREEWILETQNLTEELPWENKADEGYILKQYIIDWN